MLTSVVDFIPTPDPLLRAPTLAYAVSLPVLGITTRFESNSRYVIDTVEQTFGGWRCIDASNSSGPGESRETPELRVRIVVHDGAEHSHGSAPVRHIAPNDTRLIIHSPGSIAISDRLHGDSVAYVTTAFAADRDHFRETMLEAATLALLSHFDRHPIHAAAIARKRRAVLLAGASGSGKSTLAHLAHTAGADVLSEDRVWIQLGDGARPRVWGWPGYARLLTGHNADKRKVPLPADHAACYVADAPVVCLLARGTCAALDPLEAHDIAHGLLETAPGFDRFPTRHAEVVGALAAAGGWRLTLSADPDDALPFLQQMLSEVRD